MWSLVVCAILGSGCVVEPNLTYQWLGGTLYKTENECVEAKSNPVVIKEMELLTRNLRNDYVLMCTKPTRK